MIMSQSREVGVVEGREGEGGVGRGGGVKGWWRERVGWGGEGVGKRREGVVAYQLIFVKQGDQWVWYHLIDAIEEAVNLCSNGLGHSHLCH